MVVSEHRTMKQTHCYRTAVLLNPVYTLQDELTRYSGIGIILYQTLRDIIYIYSLSFSSSLIVQKIKLSNQVERWFTIQDLFHLLYNSRYKVLSEILTSIWPQGFVLLTRHSKWRFQFFLLFFYLGFIRTPRAQLRYDAFYCGRRTLMPTNCFKRKIQFLGFMECLTQAWWLVSF